jgi:hypothetical protein
MKLYLASYFESENFGPGRYISVSGNKPKDLDVAFVWEHVVPDQDLLDQYNKFKYFKSPEYAAKFFNEQYRKNLDFLLNLIDEECKNNNCQVNDVLGFQEGDTFLSWERADYANYRKTLGEYLQKLGYEVVIK